MSVLDIFLTYGVPILSFILLLYFLRVGIQTGTWFDRKATLSMKDLSEKTVLITGGNSGIGKATALIYAELGANVIVTCRSDKKGTTTCNDIKNVIKNKSQLVDYILLDTSSIKSVENVQKQLSDKNINEIDFLIMNAGGLGFFETKEYEISKLFKTNYLGHFHLANLLLPIIQKTALNRLVTEEHGHPCRIVTLSSVTHQFSDGQFISNKTYDDFETLLRGKDEKSMKIRLNNSDKKIQGLGISYGDSKVLSVLFMKQLAKYLSKINENGKLMSDLILCQSIHPGTVRSKILTRPSTPCIVRLLLRIVYPLYWILFRSSKIGAQSIIHATCFNGNKLINGEYIDNCKQTKTGPKWICIMHCCKANNVIDVTSIENNHIWKNLWDWSHKLINVIRHEEESSDVNNNVDDKTQIIFSS